MPEVNKGFQLRGREPLIPLDADPKSPAAAANKPVIDKRTGKSLAVKPAPADPSFNAKSLGLDYKVFPGRGFAPKTGAVAGASIAGSGTAVASGVAMGSMSAIFAKIGIALGVGATGAAIGTGVGLVVLGAAALGALFVGGIRYARKRSMQEKAQHLDNTLNRLQTQHGIKRTKEEEQNLRKLTPKQLERLVDVPKGEWGVTDPAKRQLIRDIAISNAMRFGDFESAYWEQQRAITLCRQEVRAKTEPDKADPRIKEAIKQNPNMVDDYLKKKVLKPVYDTKPLDYDITKRTWDPPYRNKYPVDPAEITKVGSETRYTHPGRTIDERSLKPNSGPQPPSNRKISIRSMKEDEYERFQAQFKAWQGTGQKQQSVDSQSVSE